MPKFLVQEIYEVEAPDLESATAQANTDAKSNSVIHVASGLKAMFNPFHLAEAQEKFSHVQPAEPTEPTE